MGSEKGGNRSGQAIGQAVGQAVGQAIGQAIGREYLFVQLRSWLIIAGRVSALPILAMAFALTLGAVVIYAAGYSPSLAYEAVWQSTFGSKVYFADTLVKTVPLIFTGVAVAIAFRGSVFNIGAEGQFLMGALAASWAGVALGGLPGPLPLLSVLLIGLVAGGLFGALAGFLKARLGVSEVISTIMLNYVAMRLVGFAVTGPLKEVGGANPQTARIAPNAMLGIIVQGTRLHWGFFLALLVAVLAYYLLFKTTFGFEVQAVGYNPVAAGCSGINISRNIVLTMFLSGGLAGLGGAVELSGVSYRLYEAFSPGYGYDAIAIALLAGNNPVGVLFTSFLFGALRSGSNMMQRSAGISSVFVYVFQALVVFFVAAFAVRRPAAMRSFRARVYRLIRRTVVKTSASAVTAESKSGNVSTSGSSADDDNHTGDTGGGRPISKVNASGSSAGGCKR
ncbi:MAG TPA: ABC transporter permease [Clostridia bacterium]|nr:ABC transporter permease [Clostridia bacterium]